MSQSLLAGFGKAVVKLTEDCFPADGFAAALDPLCVRALVLKTPSESAGILSMDLTSLFPDAVGAYKALFKEETGIPEENLWIAVTHTFASPHLWHAPKAGESESPRPGHKARTSEEIERGNRVNEAFYNAAREAAAKAQAALTPAQIGWGEGSCFVNASRNRETREGWWLGCDEEGFSDHSVKALRIDDDAGKPLGALTVYACQSSVTGMSQWADGQKRMSGDLAGRAAAFIEEAFGEDFTALFLCGAAGDQEPRLKAKYNYLDKEGNLLSKDLGEKGVLLLEQQSMLLGEALIKVLNRTKTGPADSLTVQRGSVVCGAKEMERDIKKLHAVKSVCWQEEGKKETDIELLTLGDFALIGVKPELSARTAVEISEGSPYALTATATMVNGGAKYMADEEGYRRITYGALNSPFMPGSAEKLRDEALKMLRREKEAGL